MRPEEKQRDVLLTIYKPKETLYMDQTGKFPIHIEQGKYISENPKQNGWGLHLD